MRRALLAAASALAVLSAVKFLHLLAEEQFDMGRAPVVFLVPIAALCAGILLAARGRNSGVWIIGAVALVLLAVFVGAIVRRGLDQQTWSDALLVFAGLPLAIVVLAATPGVLRDRRPHTR